MAKGFDAGSVVAVISQLLANPTWHFGTTGIGKTNQVAGIGNGHNAWNNGLKNTGLLHLLNKIKIAVGIKEELGNR